MLRDEVLKPAKVGPDSLTTVRTDNSPTGAPFGGYGMFWTQDDIAKVAKLLAVDHGVAGGQPGAAPGPARRDAAEATPPTVALTTSGPTPFHYNNGFWALDFMQRDDPAYTSPFSVPFMSGFGGITVALMPNGSSYYVFSDNNEFAWRSDGRRSRTSSPR